MSTTSRSGDNYLRHSGSQRSRPRLRLPWARGHAFGFDPSWWWASSGTSRGIAPSAADTFWTPAHVFIYLVRPHRGLAGAYTVLRTTLRGSAGEVARPCGFWGFRGPWAGGSRSGVRLTMLTSAPSMMVAQRVGLTSGSSVRRTRFSRGDFCDPAGRHLHGVTRARVPRGDDARTSSACTLDAGVLLRLHHHVSSGTFRRGAHLDVLSQCGIRVSARNGGRLAPRVSAGPLPLSLLLHGRHDRDDCRSCSCSMGPRLAPITACHAHGATAVSAASSSCRPFAMDVLGTVQRRVSDWIVALALGVRFL